MGLFDKIKEPIFLKDSTKDERIIEELEELASLASGDAKNQIEQQIKYIKYGLAGEKKIEFELKNSHIPMFVIHDLYLEYEGLTAQIDYLVLTKRRNFVIECKNLYGNLTISDNGDFIRTVTHNGVKKSERIYSPVTQNQRHLQLIKRMRSDEKGILTKALFEKNFDINYRSIVVLANYKGFLNTKYAPKEIAELVINADQLIDHIRKVNNEKGADDCYEKQLEDVAQYFLQQDKENPTSYIEKYRKLISPVTEDNQEATEQEAVSSVPEEATKDLSTQSSDDQSNNDKSASVSDTLQDKRTSEEPETCEEVICKRCGAAMMLRTATRGDNKGNQFLGCSRYPKCRFTLNVGSKEQ